MRIDAIEDLGAADVAFYDWGKHDDPAIFDEPDSEANVAMMDDGPERRIRGGSKAKMVAYLTARDFSAQDDLIAFQLTYRSFMTPSELMELLIARYHGRPPAHLETVGELLAWKQSHLAAIRLRVVNFLTHWLENHFRDFDDQLIARLIGFIEEAIVKNGLATTATTLKRRLKRKLLGESNSNRETSSEAPRAHVPRGFEKRAAAAAAGQPVIDLCDWNPLEVARQLTLIEFDLYRLLRPEEFLGLAWSKKNSDINAPNVKQMISRFNLVSQWVGTEILQRGGENMNERKRLLLFFIKVAQSCRQLNNYNAVFEIVSGLQAGCIYRLKKTWELLGKGPARDYQELVEFLSTDGNSKFLREALGAAKPPKLPYLGMYLTDLTFLDSGNPDRLHNGLVNFVKCRHTASIILEIQSHQLYPYHLEGVPGLRDYLLHTANILDENALHKLSLVCEPREKK